MAEKQKKGKHPGGVMIKDGFSEACAPIISGVITVFLLFLTLVFPLIYHHSYVDILETKYYTYCVIVIGMLAVTLVLALVMLFVDCKEYGGEHARDLFSRLAPANWRKTFSAADGAVLIFWLISLISTLQSEYVFESFWGNEGRYTGLFLTTWYVAFYFVVSRFWKGKGWIIELFLASGMIMCVIGITDYFQLDILDFRGVIKPEQSTIFTSTVGNINTYTAYVAMVMGVSAAMFATVKGRWRALWYYVCMTVSFFAIIMGCSDNAYLAIGGMFIFLPFVLFKTRKGILRYVIMAATFAGVIQCIDWLNQAFPDMVIGLDSLFKVLVDLPFLLGIVAVLALLAAGMYWILYRSQDGDAKKEEDLGRWPVRIWSGLMIVCALVLCFMLYDANVAGNGERYGALSNYLVFGDHWGTNRGYIWRKSVELYRDFPILHKLFGYGPDTFGIITHFEAFADMVNVTGQVFDTAHNEYIQFLMTIGPIGTLAYLVFQIGTIREMVVNRMKNPYLLACAAGALCYGCQALVNLNLPIATPMMWFLVSVGIGLGRRE